MPKKALIYGISGQDGSYLAEFLLGKGYGVVGAVLAGDPLVNLGAVKDEVTFETIDDDPRFVDRLIERHGPDEIYNLAAQSHIGLSWDMLVETVDAGALLPARIIEAIHKSGTGVRYFQASSGALFADTGAEMQTEDTPLFPRDPYGISKYVAHRLAGAYRERFGYHFCSGILYNHESPRRPTGFVTRKITNAAARIKLGKQKKLTLGNLDSVRDWGYAPDYVRGFWMMLNAPRPDDYILATGRGRSVREFVRTAFELAGLDWEEHVVVDASLVRPGEGVFIGDPSKIKRELGWSAETPFEKMVEEMLKADLELESGAPS